MPNFSRIIPPPISQPSSGRYVEIELQDTASGSSDSGSNRNRRCGGNPGATPRRRSLAKSAAAPRDTMVARFRDDHRRAEKRVGKVAMRIAKLEMPIDVDEGLSIFGGIMTNAYQAIKEKAPSFYALFQEIQGLARSERFMEYYGAVTFASGKVSYGISTGMNALITPASLLPLKAGIGGTVAAVRNRRAVAAEQEEWRARARLLKRLSEETGRAGGDGFYPDRLAAVAERKDFELGTGLVQTTHALRFALVTLASAIFILAKSNVANGFQAHTLHHRSEADHDLANRAGVAASLLGVVATFCLAMMPNTMRRKNGAALEDAGEGRRIVLENQADALAPFAEAHLDGLERYLEPTVRRGGETALRHAGARVSDALLRYRFHDEFGKENRSLEIGAWALLASNTLTLAAGVGNQIGMPILSDARMLMANFVAGVALSAYDTAKVLTSYVHGHHGQQDREAWRGGNLALLNRTFHMMADAVGHDGTGLRAKLLANIEADRALRADIPELTDGRFGPGDRGAMRAWLRDGANIAEILPVLAKFVGNRAAFLEASLAGQQTVHTELERGLDGCLATGRHAKPVRQMVRELNQRNRDDAGTTGAMLDRASFLMDRLPEIEHDPAAADEAALFALAHEAMRVLHHERGSAPSRFRSDILDEIEAFLDPHEAGHAEEDALGILAEAHISALAVKGAPHAEPSSNPFRRGAHPLSPVPRHSMISS